MTWYLPWRTCTYPKAQWAACAHPFVRKITAPLHYIREDPMLNTRLLGYAQKDQRKDVFEAVWWQKE